MPGGLPQARVHQAVAGGRVHGSGAGERRWAAGVRVVVCSNCTAVVSCASASVGGCEVVVPDTASVPSRLVACIASLARGSPFTLHNQGQGGPLIPRPDVSSEMLLSLAPTSTACGGFVAANFTSIVLCGAASHALLRPSHTVNRELAEWAFS